MNGVTEQVEPFIDETEKNDNDAKSEHRYPKRIFLIIGSEFCERFSYYGMRTVLVLYFRNFLALTDDDSTSLFHVFAMLSFFTPLLGGIISDSYWGKYKTILVLSIVYIAGHGLKTLAAIPFIESRAAHIAFSVLGLLMIALGTGGIKPCVSSFGGDQFHPSQVVPLKRFFSMFYFSINCGALLAKIIMPIFRADVRCYPGHTGPQFEECYSLAFGIPGLLMVVATVILVAGSPYYTNNKPTGSVFLKFCKCIISACRNRWNSKPGERNKKHWIDYANSSARMKRDSKYVLAVLMIFAPLPMFWALFDQQGSRWTLQALQMDRQWGSYLLKPEQMDTVNPLLILILIPLFEATLYPFLRQQRISFSAIKKMTAGLILAGVAFIVTAIVQFEIDISNTAEKFLQSSNIDVLEISYTSDCFAGNRTFTIIPVPGKIMDVAFSPDLQLDMHPLITKQHEGDTTELSFVNAGNESIEVIIGNVSYSLKGNNHTSGILQPLGIRSYTVYRRGKILSQGEIHLKLGGLYSVYIAHNGEEYEELQIEDVNHFSINVAWMLPQYIIITVGEVFLSVTGLEFAYTQAPPSMRSVVTSFWLLTISIGNVIVIIVAQMKTLDRVAHEFILFAVLIFIAAGIFMILGKRYTPVDEKEFENDDKNDDDETERPNKDHQIETNKI